MIKQITYLETKLYNLMDSIDPEKSALLRKEIAKHQLNLERQAMADHNLEIQSELFKGDLKQAHSELVLISGGIIREHDKQTTMEGFKDHLEDEIGGPLAIDQQL